MDGDGWGGNGWRGLEVSCSPKIQRCSPQGITSISPLHGGSGIPSKKRPNPEKSSDGRAHSPNFPHTSLTPDNCHFFTPVHFATDCVYHYIVLAEAARHIYESTLIITYNRVCAGKTK